MGRCGIVVGLKNLIDPDEFAVTAFGVDKVNDAVAHVAANARPFRMTIVQP
jgi:alcohol dehydrogenase